MNKHASIIFFTLIGYSLLFPEYSRAETTGASFLSMDTSAKAAAMGGAFIGIDDDVSAMNYNPAGIAQLDKKSFAAQHTEWLADTRHDFIAAAFPSARAVFGIGAIYLSHGNIEGRDENRAVTEGFSASDLAIISSCGRGIGETTAIGANIKFIRQSIADESATGVAFDVGAMRKIADMPLTVGAAVQNIGPKMKFVSEEYNLPLSVVVGGAYEVGDLTFAADVKQRVYESATSASYGVEYSPVPMLALRAGYRLPLSAPGGSTVAGSDLLADKLTDAAALSAGFGFNLSGFRADYAFVPYQDMGTAHRFSFIMLF